MIISVYASIIVHPDRTFWFIEYRGSGHGEFGYWIDTWLDTVIW